MTWGPRLLAGPSLGDLGDGDLVGANLAQATITGVAFDDATRWPDGFDPVAAGAVRVPAGGP